MAQLFHLSPSFTVHLNALIQCCRFILAGTRVLACFYFIRLPFSQFLTLQHAIANALFSWKK